MIAAGKRYAALIGSFTRGYLKPLAHQQTLASGINDSHSARAARAWPLAVFTVHLVWFIAGYLRMAILAWQLVSYVEINAGSCGFDQACLSRNPIVRRQAL